MKNNFVLPRATANFHYLEYVPGQMYCFYPSLDAEKGSVQVFSYVPEFILEFLYSVEIEQWRTVSVGKSLQGKHKDKGKYKKVMKSGSNVTLADFLKSELIKKPRIKRTVTNKNTKRNQDKATLMKTSNINIETRGGGKRMKQ